MTTAQYLRMIALIDQEPDERTEDGEDELAILLALHDSE